MPAALNYHEKLDLWLELAKKGEVSRSKQFLQDYPGISIEAANNSNQTALLLAARHGRVDMVSWLIEDKSANILAVDTKSNTLLHHACSNSQIHLFSSRRSIITLALEQVKQGLDVNAANANGETALDLALRHEANISQVRAFLDAGAKPGRGRNLAIAIAAGNDFHEALPLLIEHGARVVHTEVNDPSGRGAPPFSFPLHAAAQQGAVKSAEILLRAGAWVNMPNGNGDTPLARAVASTYSDDPGGMARLLMDAGADPLRRNDMGLRAVDMVSRETAEEAPALRDLFNALRDKAEIDQKTPTVSAPQNKPRL